MKITRRIFLSLALAALMLPLVGARAGSLALSGSDQTLFSDVDGGNCISITVRNRDTSTDDALVKVTPLHRAGEYIAIAPGTEKIFRKRKGGITKVEAKTSGTATVDYGVIEDD